mmetsp:Transcript_3230/g.6477  ORF Transcript_3230/g.6477 Transcript_3230/m.6477 type:complete len:238 (+) Transcript_3230:743-1456(+)
MLSRSLIWRSLDEFFLCPKYSPTYFRYFGGLSFKMADGGRQMRRFSQTNTSNHGSFDQTWVEHEFMLRGNFVRAANSIEFTQDHSGIPSDTDLSHLERRLGHLFTDRALLVLALTHRSAASPNSRVLSWVGDAALQLAITEQLAGVYGCLTPGDLTVMRSELASRENCTQNALFLGLAEMMIIGKSVRVASGKPSDSMLAETFEAVLGAVYVDGGLNAVRKAYGQNFPLPTLDSLQD